MCIQPLPKWRTLILLATCCLVDDLETLMSIFVLLEMRPIGNYIYLDIAAEDSAAASMSSSSPSSPSSDTASSDAVASEAS